MSTHSTQSSGSPLRGDLAASCSGFSSPFEVVCDPHGCRLVASRAIRAGERVLVISGSQRTKPSKYSVQIDEHLHLDVAEDCPVDVMKARHPWCFLNHSCDANTYVRGTEVVALRDIGVWDDVTFNYNTTEYRMASPFACRCGARTCLGEIRGFSHLPAAERERLRPWLAAHLQRHLAPSLVSAASVGSSLRA